MNASRSRGFLLIIIFLASQLAIAQTPDTTLLHELRPFEIVHTSADSTPGLPEVHNLVLLTGSKTEVISLAQTPNALPLKTGRQVFAKIPGVMVYDMDGSGNQFNIATRGLDPHRGWEFNMRKDGFMTNSDVFGYPASHYSMPLESIERIELVRGTAASQYGAQFGGTVNFVTKSADTTKVFSFESTNSIGSYNLASTYNAIHGRVGRFTYYAFYAQRKRNGYRDNERSLGNNQSVRIDYAASKTLTLSAEWSRSYYQFKIPGPLTDSMFASSPTQATRNRNYYSPEISIPAFRMSWKPSNTFSLQLSVSYLSGSRNSVMFDRPANIPDTINSVTGLYANRQVDIDLFSSSTNELRMNYQFKVGSKKTTLASGIQYLNNTLRRRQQGRGTAGSDYDLTLTNSTFGRNLRLKSQGLSAYTSWQVELTPKLHVLAALRWESGYSKLTGDISYYSSDALAVNINHTKPLGNLGFSYQTSRSSKVYGSIGQAWRPVILKDLIPTSIYEVTDKNIKDAFGYNAELGVKGYFKNFSWDINGFVMQYNNRLGTLPMQAADGTYLVYRTNIGNSRSLGLEWLVQYKLKLSDNWDIETFSCGALMNAIYTNASVRDGNALRNISGNEVESAPRWNVKHALGISWKELSLQAQGSYVSATFADALNTETPDAVGSRGKVPAYALFDANAVWEINQHFCLRATINNITNTSYFTKRPQLYPGPGVWPSDGRNGVLTFTVKF